MCFPSTGYILENTVQKDDRLKIPFTPSMIIQYLWLDSLTVYIIVYISGKINPKRMGGSWLQSVRELLY